MCGKHLKPWRNKLDYGRPPHYRQLMGNTEHGGGGIVSLCETPEWLCGSENVTSVSVDVVVRSKWVKYSFLGELSLLKKGGKRDTRGWLCLSRDCWRFMESPPSHRSLCLIWL